MGAIRSAFEKAVVAENDRRKATNQGVFRARVRTRARIARSAYLKPNRFPRTVLSTTLTNAPHVATGILPVVDLLLDVRETAGSRAWIIVVARSSDTPAKQGQERTGKPRTKGSGYWKPTPHRITARNHATIRDPSLQLRNGGGMPTVITSPSLDTPPPPAPPLPRH